MKSQVTPMMAQYLDIKSQYPDALLFYRMGDFYEMFFEDAVAAAEALDIALTKRGKHDGNDIPMCGVPAHSSDSYLLTLIRKGFRVAICEQMESPEEARKRGSKSVVKREVVRLVTPGTLTEDSLLNARQHNYLAAYCDIRDEGALAWCDVSTGDFRVMPCPPVRLTPELARLVPRELIVPDTMKPERLSALEEFGAALTPLAQRSFDSTAARSRLCSVLNVATLDGFGTFDRAELAAMGAIVDYLEITQKGALPRLKAPRKDSVERLMQIDAASRRNLELTSAMSGGRANSLLSVIDRTVTAAGGRLLERRLAAPSRDPQIIRQRQEAVAYFVAEPMAREDLVADLRQTPDIDRALARLVIGRGGPRDLAAIRDGLVGAQSVAERFSEQSLPAILQPALEDLGKNATLKDLLETALVAEPPLQLRDGGFIAAGFDEELDEARKLRDEGRGVIASLQSSYSELSGVQSLKIKHNNVLGYFIETTATHAEKMMSPPLSEQFIHRQTTANAVRFTTVELSELETKILNAGGRALELERQAFDQLLEAVVETADTIQSTARALALYDFTSALANCAVQNDWTRPQITEDRDFEISGGRHPVVEASLAREGKPFVANNCQLTATGSAAISLLTGPNMAGKSTYLRQNALIAILAQIGSYVPAETCKIGIVSQVFSRVGASDDLARGRSTFMVEMVETAAILNQADDRSLVILDEIGRGTATYDGLSIAWATLEYLHDFTKCRGLFATHYHEMTSLSDKLDGVFNATVAVKEWKGDVVFLHEVRDGAADRSYGVQVAKLAGLPDEVIRRAQTVLRALESGDRDGSERTVLLDDLPLFAFAPEPVQQEPEPSEIVEIVRNIKPDEMTARQALDLIYELKSKAN